MTYKWISEYFSQIIIALAITAIAIFYLFILDQTTNVVAHFTPAIQERTLDAWTNAFGILLIAQVFFRQKAKSR